ncbi:acetylcholine receptor subunit beta-like isoform X1 [Mya arenaria]|uniref:acetylcholine receptor subunit beta-like isoform X1 n=1 Tax=Mya arenaria TaxID=6604 RepID=UPI0022E54250|nr:acetylcholine receptor subunit beta-like isoform X1 [Mya arenaria]
MMEYTVCTVSVLFILAAGAKVKTTPNPNTYVEEAIQIFNTIFHKYDLNVPPRKNFPDPLWLGVNVHVSHVTSLNLIEQSLESTIDLELTWDDNRLGWYPQNVYEIAVNKDTIWVPDISIDNAIDVPALIDDPRVVIKHEGRMYWHRRFKIKTSCVTNATALTDDCEIVIGSNLLNDRVVDFKMNDSSCDPSQAVTSHELRIDDVTVEKRGERRWLKDNVTFPEYVCTLRLTRTGCCSNGGDSGETSYFLGSNNDNTNGGARDQITKFVLALFTLLSMKLRIMLV